MGIHKHPLDNNKVRDLKPWILYLDKKERRLLLSFDINDTYVILMVVKEYAPDEKREFNPIPIEKFQRMIDKRTRIEEYVPKV